MGYIIFFLLCNYSLWQTIGVQVQPNIVSKTFVFPRQKCKSPLFHPLLHPLLIQLFSHLQYFPYAGGEGMPRMFLHTILFYEIQHPWFLIMVQENSNKKCEGCTDGEIYQNI